MVSFVKNAEKKSHYPMQHLKRPIGNIPIADSSRRRLEQYFESDTPAARSRSTNDVIKKAVHETEGRKGEQSNISTTATRARKAGEQRLSGAGSRPRDGSGPETPQR